jgi:Tfp pilus assembly protein PilF
VTPLADLRVLSWTTARSFQGNPKRADELARDLGIRYLVEGAVLDAGSRWQVDIRLVDAVEDRVVFADRFGANGREILALQTTMADSVGGHLELHLAGRLVEPFWQKVVAPEAFLAYVRAVQLGTMRAPDQMKQAVGLLEEAIAIAPDFVPARAALAVMRFYCDLWLRGEARRDSAAVQKLIAQCVAEAPGIAATQFGVGLLGSANCEWDASDTAYRQVLAALPSETRARGNLALNLMVRRRFDEAQQMIEVSRGLETEQATMHTQMGLHVLKGEVEHTVAIADKMLLSEPRNPVALFFKADALGFDARDEARTRAAIEQMDPLQQNSSRLYLDACVAVASGDTSRIRCARDNLVAAAETGGAEWFHVVQVDAVLGDSIAGTRHMKLAIDNREAAVQNVSAMPRLASLRRDEAFRAQVRRLNLPV